MRLCGNACGRRHRSGRRQDTAAVKNTAAIKDIAGGREHRNGRKKRRGRYCIRSLGRNMLESYRDLTDEQLIAALKNSGDPDGKIMDYILRQSEITMIRKKHLFFISQNCVLRDSYTRQLRRRTGKNMRRSIPMFLSTQKTVKTDILWRKR